MQKQPLSNRQPLRRAAHSRKAYRHPESPHKISRYFRRTTEFLLVRELAYYETAEFYENETRASFRKSDDPSSGGAASKSTNRLSRSRKLASPFFPDNSTAIKNLSVGKLNPWIYDRQKKDVTSRSYKNLIFCVTILYETFLY